MKKTRQTLKVGDIFKHEDNDMRSRCVKWDSSTPAQTWRLEEECKVWDILPTGIIFERVSYTEDSPFETTFEELERVGILDKVEEQEFNVGDEVECINLTNLGKTPYPYFAEDNIKIGDRLIVRVTGDRLRFEGKTYCFDKTSFKKVNTMTNTYKKGDIFKIEKGLSISYATKDDSKDWSNGYLASGKYEIKQITKTQVYFNEERKLDSNWYIMKTKVFESIAVFDKPAEAPKTKTIIGYKQVKDGLNSNIGDIFSPEGVFKLPTPFASGIGQTVVTVNVRPEKLLDTEWFTPVYEEDFKVGDWVVFQFDKAAPMYKTSVWNQNMTLQISRMEDGGKALRFDGQHPRGDSASMGNHVSCFRKATKEEIEEATTRKISNIGSKNTTLILDKDGNTIKIVGKTERLFLNKLTTVYDNISVSAIGEFNIQPFSRTERLFRVGCEQEDNRVSLQEIKAVIDKFKK